MLTDPQTITIAAVAQTLPRVSSTQNSSVYRKDDGLFKFTVAHTEGKRNRHNVRLDAKKVAADPLTSENMEFGMSVYLVMDVPPVGYSNTEAKDVALGFIAWLTSANLLKVLGFET